MAGDDRKRVPVASERSPGRNFDVFKEPTVPIVYADGIGNLMMGPSVARVDLFNVISIAEPLKGSTERLESREVTAVLVMPTVAFLEMCRNVLRGAKQNDSKFEGVTASERAKIVEILSSVEMLGKSKT